MADDNIISPTVSSVFNKDQYAARDKARVLAQQEKSARFSSIKDISTFMAGIFSPIGLSLILTNAGVATGVAFLAVGAVAIGTAVVTNIFAQRYGASAYFDQSEANARHNAKYIVQEFSKAASKAQEPVEHLQNQRADGKLWIDVTRASLEQQASAGIVH